LADEQASQGRVTFGLYLENLHPAGEDLGRRLREHREQIALAREAGFSSIVFGQHILTQPIQMLSPIPHLTNLADISGDMQLVLGVMLLPLLDPVLLAEDLATADWLCDGRLVIGLGLGYRKEEYAALRVEMGERVGRFNEALAVMRAIWSANGSWSFEGKYFRFEALPGGLKPKQQPHPPIWLAADVDAAVRRAARLGAAWYINPRAELSALVRQLGVYREALAQYGTEAPAIFPIRREAFLASSEREARTMAVRYLKRQLALYESWGQYQIMPDGEQPSITFSEDDIPDTYLVGTPEHVGDLIARYVEALGVNHFVVRTQWPGTPHDEVMKSIETIGAKLVPRFS
jgi:alkanesulfonate monooxygenase SsuD/methylene tetrahydromethanopterin reductase-like flavin-dependent oxidoreductase (luciferase family)